MNEQGYTVNDLIPIFQRRKWFAILPFLSIFLLAVLLAFVWPPTYQSQAIILIEEQEIPSDLIRSTVTTFAAQRIQSISQRVLVREHLVNLIEKFNLYANERKDDPIESVLTTMRDSVNIEMISADVIDPQSGKPTQATIAFKVSFQYDNPETVQKVTNELTSLFLNENIVIRTRAAEEATFFLEEEAKRLSEQISALEVKIAHFKKENMHQLPELNQFNLTTLSRFDHELVNVDTQVRTLQERKFFLESQLAQIDPTFSGMGQDGQRIASKEEQLKLLNAQLPTLLARYFPNHPDVMSTRRQIKALEAELGTSTDTQALDKQLADAKTQSSALKKRYSNNHPDVLRTQKTIQALESAITDAGNREALVIAVGQPAANNPAYITLQAQLKAVTSELKSLEIAKKELAAKQIDIRLRLTSAPLVEQEYQALLRDYANTTHRYQEIKAKVMEAQIAKQLEIERKSERFSLIEPPQYPLEPIKPHRTAIIFLGFMFGIAGGLGLVALTHAISQSIDNGKDATVAAGIAPLIVIPYLEDERDLAVRQKNRRIALSCAMITLLAGLAVIHNSVIPLDVAWYKLKLMSTPQKPDASDMD